MQKTVILIAIIIILMNAAGCDKGIEPLPEKVVTPGVMGFSGKVTFTGTWPSGVMRTHIVVFKDQIKTSDDFFPPNLSFVIDSIPYRSSEFSYNSVDNNFISVFKLAPGNYNYIVVAQSKTPLLSLDRKDWFIVGVYYKGTDLTVPGVLTLNDGIMTTGVNIRVDFNNPPPQPPGGQ